MYAYREQGTSTPQTADRILGPTDQRKARRNSGGQAGQRDGAEIGDLVSFMQLEGFVCYVSRPSSRDRVRQQVGEGEHGPGSCTSQPPADGRCRG